MPIGLEMEATGNGNSVANRKGVGQEGTHEKVASMDNGTDSVWLDSTVRRDESSDRSDSGGLVDLV